MNGKKFFLGTVALSLSMMILLAIPTVYIDPLFHYHAPAEGVSYELKNERYQNDGILRNFEYDAVIIGTSMTQNFKTSEMDALFGTNSVKVPLAGGYFREIGDRLRAAYSSDNEIKQVVLSLDNISILAHKDALSYEDYPEYLYDSDPINDVGYLFNKRVLVDYTLSSIRRTLAGKSPTAFDEYSGWAHLDVFGRDRVMAGYQRPEPIEERKELSAERLEAIRQNLEQNILPIIREHPETVFYCFIPPYSIAKLDSWYVTSSAEYNYEIFEQTARMLLSEENVRVFCFFEDTEILCDLDRYRDSIHYDGTVNSYILESMAHGEHELKEETLAEYFDSLHAIYSDFDFDAVFE